jgi:hypothetical protein
LIQAFFVLSPLPSSQARATITHSRRSAIYLSMSAMLEGSSMKPWVKRAPSSTTRRSSQSQPATLIPRCIRVDSATTARVDDGELICSVVVAEWPCSAIHVRYASKVCGGQARPRDGGISRGTLTTCQSMLFHTELTLFLTANCTFKKMQCNILRLRLTFHRQTPSGCDSFLQAAYPAPSRVTNKPTRSGPQRSRDQNPLRNTPPLRWFAADAVIDGRFARLILLSGLGSMDEGRTEKARMGRLDNVRR